MKQVMLVGLTGSDNKSAQPVNGPGVFGLIDTAVKRGQRIGGCWSSARMASGTGNGTPITGEPVTLEDLVAVKA